MKLILKSTKLLRIVTFLIFIILFIIDTKHYRSTKLIDMTMDDAIDIILFFVILQYISNWDTEDDVEDDEVCESAVNGNKNKSGI